MPKTFERPKVNLEDLIGDILHLHKDQRKLLKDKIPEAIISVLQSNKDIKIFNVGYIRPSLMKSKTMLNIHTMEYREVDFKIKAKLVLTRDFKRNLNT